MLRVGQGHGASVLLSKGAELSADESTTEPMLVRIDRAAELLGLSQATVYRLIAAGDLRSVRFGRAHRVPSTELTRLIDERLECS